MELTVNIRRQLDHYELNTVFTESDNRIGIFGPSGAGKTQTLKMIAGIVTPDSGRIVLGDRVLFDSEKKINVPPQKRRVGYLFQNYALFPNMTVEQNIAAGIRNHMEDGMPGEKRHSNRGWLHSLRGQGHNETARVQEMIRKFRLEGLEKSYPKNLSGGQQQRVALARIMAYEPELILLDEPFSALDSRLRSELQQELTDMLAEYEGTVILVSHDRDEIRQFSRKLIILEDGIVKDHGDTGRILGNAVVSYVTQVNRQSEEIKDRGMNTDKAEFSHFDTQGNARMVDVSDKEITQRAALARGEIRVSQDVFEAIEGKLVKKGDVLTVAQVAGIMGTKKTSDLIPMCHILNLTGSKVWFEMNRQSLTITAYCRVKTEGRTGVEMEALTGVSTALLTIYDMCKAIDKRMEITGIHLVEKTGGKSGDFLYER